jgi:hypothetical protein
MTAVETQNVTVEQPRGPGNWIFISAGNFHVRLTPEQALQVATEIADILAGSSE